MADGRTQEEVADEVGVPVSNLSKWRKLAAEGTLGRERFQQAKVVRSATDPAMFFGDVFARVEA